MKKILVPINGKFIPQHVVDCGIRIANTTSSFIHVVLVNYSLDFAEYDYPFPNDLSLTRNYMINQAIAEEDSALLEHNTRLLEDEFRSAKVDFYIDREREISLGQLIDHSAFSDLILTDAHEYLGLYHLADLLTDAHCPVYLVSKEIEKVENIIITYDGSFSCMHAIKTFTYIFPELKDLPIYLIHIAPQNTGGLPREKEFKSWLQRHYSKVQIKIIQGDLRDELVNFTKSIPGSLTVMGSFGRSAISRFFHKSLARTIIEEGNSSLFIAHE